MRCDDLSGGDFERRKQRCRAMPLVVVALAGQSAAIGQLQIALRSLQSLDRRLFVHAQHNCLLGRGDIEANNIGGFGRKVRVVALTPGLASREVNLVAAQEPPDILDINIAQRPGQQGPGPACEPFRRRLIQQLQNPLVGGLRIDRLLGRPRLVSQPFKAMVGIAMPPETDNPRLDPNFLGYRAGAAPGRRQLGTVEITIGLLTLLGVFSRRWGIVGATLSFLTAFVTLSFLITTPEAWVSALGDAQHGFPYLSGGGRLVLKDIMLLAGALLVMADSARAFLEARPFAYLQTMTASKASIAPAE